MQKIVMISRLLLGLIFLVFGSNGLMMIFMGKGFIPMPPPGPEMQAVMQGLFGAKYLMPTVKILQVFSALLLLTNIMVPLALLFLGPIVFNIVGVHLFVEPAGLPMALLVSLLYLTIFMKYIKAFMQFLRA